MKLLYISNVKMPTNKAHGVHMIKMCEAFAAQGLDVTFVVPRRRSSLVDDPYEYYNVQRIFTIKKIFSVDLIDFVPFFGYWIQFVSFSLCAAIRYAFSSRRNIRIHTREHIVAIVFKLLGFTTTYEAHRVISKKGLYFSLLRGMNAIVTNSQGVADEFKEKGFKKVLAAPNAVNAKDFDIRKTKTELRTELSLPQHAPIALYSGHLYAWKGVDTVVEAARLLAADGVEVVCVGGTDEDVERYRNTARTQHISNIHFVGHVKNALVPSYLKATDVLLLPNSPISEESIKYTSPMKLFEYMASGVPIVVSDLPSMREVLDDRTAIFFTPDDPQSLYEGVSRLLHDRQLADTIASHALAESKKYSWEGRARSIMDFANYRV